MAYVQTNETTAPATGRISGFFADVKARFTQYGVYRATVNELSGLTDRELNDLGLSRSAIRGIAMEVAYKN